VKRALRWLLPLLAVLVVGGFVARALIARKTETVQQAALMTRGPQALELAPADIVTARSVELTRRIAVSGGLKAFNSAVVKAKVAAEVKTLTVREGDAVKAGQVLGQLDTTELDWRLRQAEQTAQASRAQLDIARRALDNNRALVAQGFISATGLETSIANEAAAQATLQAALAAVELARKAHGDAQLMAPIAGLVAQRLVQPGERVAVDARLIEIVDLSRLELEAAIAPDDVGSLAVGQVATLNVDGIAAPVEARVARINPSAQSGSRSVLAYLAVPGQPALRQGLFARGQIEVSRLKALAVPLTAVRIDQALPYVLVVDAGKVVARTVPLGRRGSVDGQDWVEVGSGLVDGATLLAGSTGQVRDGTPVRLTGPSGGGAPAAGVPASAATGNGTSR
jgi:RND family efflux transporter MFP subunit